MIKIVIVFLIGLLEQLLYTAYLLSVNKKQVNKSSILMFSYMVIYLFIISFALKDSETIPLLIAYALSCGIGNYVIMLWETWDFHFEFWGWKDNLDLNKYGWGRIYKTSNGLEGYLYKFGFWISKKNEKANS